MSYTHSVTILCTAISLVSSMVIPDSFVARPVNQQPGATKFTITVDADNLNNDLEHLLSNFINGKTREEVIRKLSQAGQQMSAIKQVGIFDDEDFPIHNEQGESKRAQEDTANQDKDNSPSASLSKYSDNKASDTVATVNYKTAESAKGDDDQKLIGSVLDLWKSGDRFFQWFAKKYRSRHIIQHSTHVFHWHLLLGSLLVQITSLHTSLAGSVLRFWLIYRDLRFLCSITQT